MQSVLPRSLILSFYFSCNDIKILYGDAIIIFRDQKCKEAVN